MTDQKDPHWGKGGRYQIVDGQRVPVTPPPAESPLPPATHEPATEAPAQPIAKKGK